MEIQGAPVETGPLVQRDGSTLFRIYAPRAAGVTLMLDHVRAGRLVLEKWNSWRLGFRDFAQLIFRKSGTGASAVIPSPGPPSKPGP